MTGQLWGSDNFTGCYFIMNKTTGDVTEIAHTQARMEAIAFDHATGKMHGFTDFNRLVEIDPYAATWRFGHSLTGIFQRGAKGLEFASVLPTFGAERGAIGCMDSGGTHIHTIFQGEPRLGSTVKVGSFSSPGLTNSVALGFANLPWSGPALPFEYQPGCFIRVSLDVMIGPLAPGQRVEMPIPNDAIFSGVITHWQGFAIDPALLPLPLLPATTSTFASQNDGALREVLAPAKPETTKSARRDRSNARAPSLLTAMVDVDQAIRSTQRQGNHRLPRDLVTDLDTSSRPVRYTVDV